MDGRRKSMKMKSNSNILNNRISHVFGVGECYRLRSYINLIESHFIRENKSLDDLFDEKSLIDHSKIVGEFHKEYLNYLISEHHKEKALLSYDFPNSFRSGFVIQIFSFLEFELRSICEYHASKISSNFSVTDLRGTSDIDKAKLYLNKSTAVDLNDLNPEWLFIDNMRTIRNRFVHHQGLIPAHHNDFNKINNFARGNNILLRKVDRDEDVYQLVIASKYFLLQGLDIIESFINKLLKKIQV